MINSVFYRYLNEYKQKREFTETGSEHPAPPPHSRGTRNGTLRVESVVKPGRVTTRA